MLKPKDNNLQLALNFLNFSGLNYQCKLPKKYFSAYFLLPSTIIFLVMVSYTLLMVAGDIIAVSEVFESMSTFLQLAIRKLVFLYHGRVFHAIVKEREQFWDYDTFGPQLAAKIRRFLKYIIICTKIFIGIVTVTIIWLISLPVLIDGKDLPERVWIPFDSGIIKNVIYLFQLIWFSEIIIFVGAFDAFFVIICVEMTMQFRLLNTAIGEAVTEQMVKENRDEVLRKLKECTSYHNHLISVHKKIAQAFSEYFVGQYVITVMVLCILFFLMRDEKTTQLQIVKAIFYLMSVFTQVALVFFTASFIAEEAEMLPNVIYESEWYLADDAAIRKHLLFMLMKAQEPLELSAGNGLFYINKSQFLAIFRISFSISTILAS